MRLSRTLLAAMLGCLTCTATVNAQETPSASTGKALPSPDRDVSVLTFGSDLLDRLKPILMSVAADHPDLFVMLGDAVFTDDKQNEPKLTVLSDAYAKLARDPEFMAFRAQVPMVATWDDHDFGTNDGDGSFLYKARSQALFDGFWGGGPHHQSQKGVYDAYTFGTPGRRVQLILLDTRYDRSSLTRLKVENGTGHYTPSSDIGQRMLSDAQWQWLAARLKEPADVRILVSSIQIMADAHHWESWDKLPREQARLYALIRSTGAKGLVFISGDRVLGGLYRRDDVLPYPAYELTTSALNLPWSELSKQTVSSEISTGQIGSLYPDPNFGEIRIDWAARKLTMRIKAHDGRQVQEETIPFDDLAPNDRSRGSNENVK